MNDNIKNIIGFGRDLNGKTQPIGIEGEENDELIILSITELELFQSILQELKKFNIQLESITNTRLTNDDAKSYKDKL